MTRSAPEFLSVTFGFSDSDVASFDGSGCLLYRLSPDQSQTAKETVSLKFKTQRNSGTLIHAEAHEHSLTLELHKGKLLLHLRKGTAPSFFLPMSPPSISS